MTPTVALTDIRGRRVADAEGRDAGRVADLLVHLRDKHPRVRQVLLSGRHGDTAVDAADIDGLTGDRPRLRPAAVRRAPDGDLLRLARDVLDAQVFDVGGRRMSRVADVVLVPDGDGLRVAGVDMGGRAVARRLGLGRLAGPSREQPVDWASVHLTSRQGHTMELDAASERLTRLPAAALAGLVATLPTERAAAVLGAVGTERAADAVGRQRPGHGGRLLHAVGAEHAARLVGRMPADDAAAALRHTGSHTRETVLGALAPERADTLRGLLGRPPGVAGGMMNPDVVRVPEGADAAAIRAAVAAAAPPLDALLTAFVVDADGRPVGAVPPRALLAGDAAPRPVHPVSADASLDAVAGVFARHDLLAAPVVDADGRLLGAVAVDDLLEELLAARMPARHRFPGRRGRRRRT